MQAKKITTQTELNQAFDIRKEVFVHEQGVPLEDEFDAFDQLDAPCEHVLVVDQDQAVGTGRLRFVEGVGKLERICILKPFRSKGIGKIIIQKLEELAVENNMSSVKLHGQTHAEGFYRKLGYETASEEFLEDGIPHVLMLKKFNQ
ncbi:GNAT family N-acetyltransferase [Sporosarcina sp. HYO08]|uniref:GNAT family N-acetyltransferase n=1 Tax=Sporosarcina sp. HYO08 TaxID=1759557 RepID=UPI0007981A7A|nr:GNAT family N-acetyltransferase [Sporosarcina sp. HYO08]KXH78549.1 hypothetical protein AU377_12780 [Sporosarcina sp. HYO08]